MPTKIRAWPLQAAFGAVLMLALSVVISIFPQINRLVDPATLWFPIPMFAVGLIAVMLTQRKNANSDAVASAWFPRAVFAVLGVSSLTALGVLLTGWDAIKAGRATLFGDLWDAPLEFRNTYSIALCFVEALTEEASMRGIVQLPTTSQLGAVKAQIVAGTLFICLHAFTRSGVGEFAFIGLTAIVCGLLAAAFRSVWVPAIVHATANTFIAFIVLAFRQ